MSLVLSIIVYTNKESKPSSDDSVQGYSYKFDEKKRRYDRFKKQFLTRKSTNTSLTPIEQGYTCTLNKKLLQSLSEMEGLLSAHSPVDVRWSDSNLVKVCFMVDQIANHYRFCWIMVTLSI